MYLNPASLYCIFQIVFVSSMARSLVVLVNCLLCIIVLCQLTLILPAPSLLCLCLSPGFRFFSVFQIKEPNLWTLHLYMLLHVPFTAYYYNLDPARKDAFRTGKQHILLACTDKETAVFLTMPFQTLAAESWWKDAVANTFYLSLSKEIKDRLTTVSLLLSFEALMVLRIKIDNCLVLATCWHGFVWQ